MNNPSPDSPDSSNCPMASGKSPLKLVLVGLGPVPSFKNGKMLARGRLITDPKKQAWMQRATAALESQLRSILATTAAATPTTAAPLCSIALSLPLDDSWQWMPEITIKAMKVKKGEEGAVLIIEEI